MKPLSQCINETLNTKPLKEVFTDKLVDEDLSDIMRTSPEDRSITRGTSGNENDRKD